MELGSSGLALSPLKKLGQGWNSLHVPVKAHPAPKSGGLPQYHLPKVKSQAVLIPQRFKLQSPGVSRGQGSCIWFRIFNFPNILSILILKKRTFKVGQFNWFLTSNLPQSSHHSRPVRTDRIYENERGRAGLMNWEWICGNESDTGENMCFEVEDGVEGWWVWSPIPHHLSRHGK